MANAQILVVEDEIIVAKDIQNTLINVGYAVPAVASSGAEAIEKAADTRPDLILMDIRLKGDIDGVQAAQQIRALFDIPVIYLTAYADYETLQRAKITEPYGYIVKPFAEKELHAGIEMALNKHKGERKLRESERPLVTAREAADFLGVSLNTLNSIEKAQQLVPYRTPGGHRRYSRAMLEEYLENSRRFSRSDQDGRPAPAGER